MYFALVSTFIWGMAAHGYMFMQSNFTHDSLAEFNGERFGNTLKIITGRFLSPANRTLFRTSLTLPWLIGVLSLLWIGLSVFFTLRIFRIESKVSAFLVAGIFTANLTVSCTVATFIHDLDADMLALLFSVIAVFFWRKGNWSWLIGAVCVMLSLAFYQSYITVTIVLVMFACILDVIYEKKFKTVFQDGIKSIGMLILGGGLYYLMLQIVSHVAGVSISRGASNSMDRPLGMPWNDFVYLTKEAYYKYFKRMATVLSPYGAEVTNAITFLLFLIVVFILILGLWRSKTPIVGKLLCVGLFILLPFAINLMHILTYGFAHELMRFSYWLSYLFVLLLIDWLIKEFDLNRVITSKIGLQKLLQLPVILSLVLVFSLLYSNVQVANVFYLKKDLEHKSYASLMTRVLYRMEEYPDYKAGETPVVMVGRPEQINSVIPGFEDYTMPNGVQVSDVMTIVDKSRCEMYFMLYLNNPAVFASDSVWNQMLLNPQVQQMPNYPDQNCIAMIDDTLVVKLGDAD